MSPQSLNTLFGRFSRLLRRLLLLPTGGILLTTLIVASPLGRVFDKSLSIHFERMNQRREQHQFTRLDMIECEMLYNSISVLGRLVSPEAGKIVYHYLHGQGEDLWLDSEYLQTSPVVQRGWQSLKPGQSRQFSLRQAEDWRLSYALNPFSLRRGEHEILLWQRIDFTKSKKVKTILNYGLGSVALPDALIHALHPTPFTVYCKWKTYP